MGHATLRQRLRFDGPPFRWKEDRRFLLRCEIDAVDYIMDTFPIVRKRDEQQHNSELLSRSITNPMGEILRVGLPGKTKP